MRRVLLWMMPALLTAGCYVYAPVSDGALRTGVQVRTHLTNDGSAELGGNLVRNVGMLEGELITLERDVLSIAVSTFGTRDGRRIPWGGDIVRVSADAVDVAEQRTFSRRRTILFIAALVAGGLIVDRAIDAVDPGTVIAPPEDNGNGGPQTLIHRPPVPSAH